MYLYEALARFVPPVAGTILLLVFVAWPAWTLWKYIREWRGRKARFADRESMPPGEWFSRYFPQIASGQTALVDLLSQLGKELDVDWTRLRPEDTFSGTFSFRRGLLFEPRRRNPGTPYLLLLPAFVSGTATATFTYDAASRRD